jgi:hypothetical protein
MKKAAIFCFLLMFFESIAYAEEYRVSDGTVQVERTEDYIKFDYIPDSFDECSHVVYLYYLRGENREYRELRIHQMTRPTIFISVNADGEAVWYISNRTRCYCALHQCEAGCGIAQVLFGMWERRLKIDRHLVNPEQVIIF